MNVWTWAWVGALALEAAAIIYPRVAGKSDGVPRTLSEHVWRWRDVSATRVEKVFGYGALGLFLAWLFVHFVFGG